MVSIKSSIFGYHVTFVAYFLGGITIIGRSENINAFIKRFVSSHINLTQFIEQVVRTKNIVNGLNLYLGSQFICVVGFRFPTMDSSYYGRPKCML